MIPLSRVSTPRYKISLTSFVLTLIGLVVGISPSEKLFQYRQPLGIFILIYLPENEPGEVPSSFISFQISAFKHHSSHQTMSQPSTLNLKTFILETLAF